MGDWENTEEKREGELQWGCNVSENNNNRIEQLRSIEAEWEAELEGLGAGG